MPVATWGELAIAWRASWRHVSALDLGNSLGEHVPCAELYPSVLSQCRNSSAIASLEKIQEAERFTKTQPLSKRDLGFGTKDAFKRGEFTAAIRTEQYR